MTDVTVNNLIINKLTKAQYDAATKSNTELYFVTDDNTYLERNNAITAGTKCKVTYDTKGLITSGTDLSASDIPNLTLSKITDVTATAAELNVLDGITASTVELNYCDGVTSNIQTQLNGKLTGNNSITAATKTKITYDAKGLVTGGADLAASDIPNLSLSKISDVTATAAELNTLDGITASTAELNYCDGVTSNIQTQLNGKVAGNSAITASTTKKLVTYDTKGLVTGGSDLTSSDVTDALGYTPYNSTNPSGYITSSDVGNGTITVTQGGTTKGTFTTNQSGNTTIALDAGGGSYTAGTGIDITNNVISNTGLINNSSAAGSLAIDTTDVFQLWSFATSIGYQTTAYSDSTAVGYRASAKAVGAIALGSNCENTVAGTFNVCLTPNGTRYTNYQLLDASGNIPHQRMGDAIQLVSSLPASPVAGVLYLIPE